MRVPRIQDTVPSLRRIQDTVARLPRIQYTACWSQLWMVCNRQVRGWPVAVGLRRCRCRCGAAAVALPLRRCPAGGQEDDGGAQRAGQVGGAQGVEEVVRSVHREVESVEREVERCTASWWGQGVQAVI